MISSGSRSFHIFDNVPPDCSGEDLSFLLDSKGPVHQQYPETYSEPQKEHLHSAKGKHLMMHRFLAIISIMQASILMITNNNVCFYCIGQTLVDSGLFNLDSFPEFSCWSSYTNSKYQI